MQNLNTLITTTVEGLGYVLVDIEVVNRGKLIRVFIDKQNPVDKRDSVTIDDCVIVSNQLGNVLTVEHEIDYDRLEISSAGMDRVVKSLSDFERFVGERADIKLKVGVDNTLNNENSAPRKHFVALLKGVDKDNVLFEHEGQLYKVALSNIDKARLSPEF